LCSPEKISKQESTTKEPDEDLLIYLNDQKYHEERIKEHYLVDTIKNFSDNFIVSFHIKLLSINEKWTSVFHMTSTGQFSHEKYGNRFCAVWVYPNRTKLHIVTSSFKKTNYHYDGFELNLDTD
jgi:hypothetical protein